MSPRCTLLVAARHRQTPRWDHHSIHQGVRKGGRQWLREWVIVMPILYFGGVAGDTVDIPAGSHHEPREGKKRKLGLGGP
jgi:hypothetical protein